MADVASLIDTYFIDMEWPFERVDAHLWRTSFPGDIQTHEVFVTTDDPQWVSFRTRVVPNPPRQECTASLYEHLLRLNSLIPLTKFCVTDNHDVFAIVDLPTADLDLSEFKTAIMTLVNHVDAYDNEIVKICSEPSHASSLKPATGVVYDHR